MAATYGGDPPWELVKALMCEHYHCLPSQLADEPAGDLLRFYQLSSLYHKTISDRAAAKAKRKK